MDIESDDSERWEDFFGSSTDLTPSLIGLYDSLTGSLHVGQEITEEDEKEETSTVDNSSSEGNIEPVSTAAGAIVAVNHSVVNKHRGFRVLSPNVKRLIAHSNTLVQKVECTLLPGNACITNGATRASKRINVKQKLSHIPLSRNTCKLTQSGNELVETFDATIQSSCESLDRLHSEVKDKIDSEIETDLVCANLLKDASDLSKIKEEEKLTANQQPLQNKTSNSRRVPEIVKRFHSVQSASRIQKEAANDKINEMSQHIERVSPQSTNTDPVDETIDNTSKMSNIQTTTSDTNSRVTKCTPPSSPLLTYSRIKSPAAKKSSNIQKLSRKLSEESLDELTDMQPIPALNYNISPKGHRKSHFILPEIARLKHRPLSSSSICSTSSSSSSGSDHPLNGKLTTSYLASVESLADQSENELLDGGSTLTVFERSCLEIVDSERIYVEDLGQVIKGYLEDWKERACLRVDELKILFSNIQDIYEFNSVLLLQLINSGMDPVKIAKCFIGLKDRFIVYTTYCTSYPAAISLLTSLLQASHTNALLTSTQKMLQHTLPLGSYLLKPVQRILKYHLLLDNLRKHCDIEEVVQAHEIMREVARSIDQVKKKLEQQSRVKELSGILDGWLGPELTVLGELRQEGLLMENNKPRMVFLFQTMLIITKPKEDNRLQFKSYIYRNNLMLREHLPGEPTSFNVIPYDEPRNQIKLTAKNRDQKRLWAQNIKGVILEQFDIPSRAKELVYKLGDEEDRTPDKSTWKWTLNSSTPVYLERRNQCRRSEIRNRSKIKRKTITNSPSLDGFNEHKNVEKRELTRQQSIDDNLITSLPKFSDGNFEKNQDCNHDSNKCECSLTEEESNRALSRTSMKERSKSVPRLPQGHITEDDDYYLTQENQNKKHDYFYRLSNLGKTKSVKAVDVKSYNAKTIPKRIATLKKSRSKKETSRFYMDLNDMDTVLKITESTENLTTSIKNDVETDLVAPCKTDDVTESSNCVEEPEEVHDKNSEEILKKDVEIISELLKEHKEFHRILKKPPKKRSFDNGSVLSSPDQQQLQYLEQTPPPPPSQSPPPLDSVDADEKPSNDQKSEHIYESLLRNVHVPYKYSPILNRSKSQQYYTNTAQEVTVKTPKRPESDYVTLIYAENGDLKSIEGTRVNPSKVETLRKSDSNINYDNITNSEQSEKTSSVLPPEMFASMSDFQGQDDLQLKGQKNLLQRFISSKSEHVSTSENSLLAKARKSADGLGFIRGNRPPERRVSDVSEMCRQSIIHRQGSEAVGERMAHLDYVDPRTLFSASVTSSAVSLNPQRDSVFSLTSSNDSVSDSKKNVQPTQSTAPLSHDRFTYEDTVEACLENDFRDSAVYSDDSERRPETVEDDDGGKPPSTPPPPLPKKQHPGKRKPLPLPKNVTPPPIPAKPNIPLKRLSSTTSNASSNSSSITSPTSEKSWVLQQIENFNK